MAVPEGDVEAWGRAIDTILGLGPEDCGQEDVLDSYRLLLHRTWERMVLLVGPLGARAVMQHAVKVASGRHPAIAAVAVAEDGPDLSKLEKSASPEQSEVHCRGVRDLCVATFQTLTELTGDVVVGPLLRKMEERH